MRLTGCARWEAGTIWATVWNAFDETRAPSAIVVPHDVIATQHGIAAAWQGFGWSLF
jgi:hypothetical protein